VEAPRAPEPGSAEAEVETEPVSVPARRASPRWDWRLVALFVALLALAGGVALYLAKK
jgi:hypothetical protein